MKWHRQFWEEPQAQADFDYWIKVPAWSPEEIVALSLGKDPRFVSSEKFVPSTRGTDFSAAYFERLDFVGRHRDSGDLDDNTRVPKIFQWAKAYVFEFPQELIKRVRKLEDRLMKGRHAHGSTPDPVPLQPSAVDASEAPEIVSSENVRIAPDPAEGVAAEAPAVPKRSEKLLDLREQQNLQLMLAAMAIKSYKFDRHAAKNDATQKIVKHLSDLGVSISKGTVVKHVRLAIDLLDEKADRVK